MERERQESKLIRNLGFWDLMAIAIGQIIGAGIMSSTGVAIGMTGTGVVLAFLISPFLTIITIFPVAVLGSAVPTTGGLYRYSSRLLGKTVGMIYLLLHVTMNVSIAQYALSFASYLVSIATGLDQYVVAIAILTFFFITNLLGTKTAALLNKIMVVVLIGGLFLFIGFGLPKTDLGYVLKPENLFFHGPFAFIATLALLSSATGGAQFLAEYGGEAKNPGKNIPKAMILSTFGVGILYVLIALVAAGILPMEQVANQPLTLVAKETMPMLVFYLFVIGAALGATATTLNATLSWVTKTLLVACDDGLLPRGLGTVSKRGVPWKLLTVFYLVGLVPLLMRFDISFITKFVTANALLSKILVCLSLYVLAKKSPELLKRSALNISPTQSKILAVVGIIILIVLSFSLLINLSVKVIIFLLVLLILVLIYVSTAAKEIKIENDLVVDYTTGNQKEDSVKQSVK